jgi:SAM-dependent methyltransferase
MNIEQVSFDTRKARSEFVAKRFADVLRGDVLDVGCFEAPLRKLLASCNYYGVDIAGNPDLTLNLDSPEPLPFPENSRDCVMCIEVLEHLENLHHVFDELVRISRRYILVSLPNCWRDARLPIERGRGHFAHYGLPVDRPLDRHRWFFNHTEARDFLMQKTARHHLRPVEMFATEPSRSVLIRMIRQIRYPGDRYLNRYSQTIWALLEKTAT